MADLASYFPRGSAQLNATLRRARLVSREHLICHRNVVPAVGTCASYLQQEGTRFREPLPFYMCTKIDKEQQLQW